MSLLAPLALFLLLATVVIVLLAALRSGPKRRDVGTLLIWERVAAVAQPRTQRRWSADLLLWLLLIGVALGAFGAARPAWITSGGQTSVAVFIERLQPGPAEPQLQDVLDRAKTELPNADLKFFMAGANELDEQQDIVSLRDGSTQATLAQFELLSADADARVLFLAAPMTPPSSLGVVLSRVSTPVADAVFELESSGDELVIRATGPDVVVTGASDVRSEVRDGVVVYTCRPVDEDVRITTSAGRELLLQRKPFVIGVGDDWTGDVHKALYEALGADGATGREPDAWLGSREQSPAIRINAGVEADLGATSLSLDPGHALFQDLPVESIDWLSAGRVLSPSESRRPLLSAVRDGEPVGDLVGLTGDGVVEFAGDPFTAAPISTAALLLDNALGVVLKQRPSERSMYELAGDSRLPTQRAAMAAPFKPQGNVAAADSGSRESTEFSSWLLVASGLLLATATILVSRRDK